MQRQSGATAPRAASPLRAPVQPWTVQQALRTREFWALSVAQLLIPTAIFPIAVHQVAYLADLGYPGEQLRDLWASAYRGLREAGQTQAELWTDNDEVEGLRTYLRAALRRGEARAVTTKGAAGRSGAAKKAARTRAKHRG